MEYNHRLNPSYSSNNPFLSSLLPLFSPSHTPSWINSNIFLAWSWPLHFPYWLYQKLTIILVFLFSIPYSFGFFCLWLGLKFWLLSWAAEGTSSLWRCNDQTNFARCDQQLARCLQQGCCWLSGSSPSHPPAPAPRNKDQIQNHSAPWRHLENIFQFMGERKLADFKACNPKLSCHIM